MAGAAEAVAAEGVIAAAGGETAAVEMAAAASAAAAEIGKNEKEDGDHGADAEDSSRDDPGQSTVSSTPCAAASYW